MTTIKEGHMLCRRLLNQIDEASGIVTPEFINRANWMCVLDCADSRNTTSEPLRYYEELTNLYPKYRQYCEDPGTEYCELVFQDGEVFNCNHGSNCPSNYIQDTKLKYRCLQQCPDISPFMSAEKDKCVKFCDPKIYTYAPKDSNSNVSIKMCYKSGPCPKKEYDDDGY